MDLLAQDLQVTLEGNHILNGVTLEAGAGELVGVIGPNGSGKSTLLKCLYRQLVPQGGAVYLNGRDLTRESRRESVQGSRISGYFLLQMHQHFLRCSGKSLLS